MNAFGLTGNIGCGKSTVASLLSQYEDISILDCDKIAKDLIATGEHRQQINEILGEEVFPEGKVNFGLIARIIFQNPAKKKLFEELTHPLVWEIVENEVAKQCTKKICIVESAIIYETSAEDKFNAVIVTICEEDEQFRRLHENRRMDYGDIVARVKNQIPQAVKAHKAQFIIKTNCGMDELRERVHNLYKILKKWKEKNYGN